MSTCLRSLVNDDIHYDEANPQYRFMFNSIHCLNALKYILLIHIAISIILTLYLMPYSIFVAPVFIIVFGTALFGIKNDDHLSLAPFQLYLFVSFLSASISSIVIPVVTYLYKHEILGHYGFHNASSHFVTLMLLLNIVLIQLVLAGLLFWQWSIVTACRDYFWKIREQSDYAQLSIPESFVNSKIIEQQPFVGKKSADYMVFSMDHVNLDDSSADEENVVEKIVEDKKVVVQVETQ